MSRTRRRVLVATATLALAGAGSLAGAAPASAHLGVCVKVLGVGPVSVGGCHSDSGGHIICVPIDSGELNSHVSVCGL